MARNDHSGRRTLRQRILTATAAIRCMLDEIEQDAKDAPEKAVSGLAAMIEEVSAELPRMRGSR